MTKIRWSLLVALTLVPACAKDAGSEAPLSTTHAEAVRDRFALAQSAPAALKPEAPCAEPVAAPVTTCGE